MCGRVAGMVRCRLPAAMDAIYAIPIWSPVAHTIHLSICRIRSCHRIPGFGFRLRRIRMRHIPEEFRLSLPAHTIDLVLKVFCNVTRLVTDCLNGSISDNANELLWHFLHHGRHSLRVNIERRDEQIFNFYFKFGASTIEHTLWLHIQFSTATEYGAICYTLWNKSQFK